MNKGIKRDIEKIRKIGLTPEEKSGLWGRVMTYAESRPGGEELSFLNWLSLVFKNKIFRPHWVRVTALALVMAMALSGAAWGAEGTLPGDALYPVKLALNEPLRGLFITDDLARALWESKKVERRLGEAERLVSQNLLGSELREIIEKHLESYTGLFDSLVKSVNESRPSEQVVKARSDFEVMMKAHAKILGRMENRAPAPQKENVARLKNTLEGKTREVAEKRLSAETKFLEASQEKSTERPRAESATLFENKKEAVASLIQKVKEDLENEKKDLEIEDLKQDIIKESASTLEAAQGELEAAEEKKNSGRLDEALPVLFSSERSAQEASISLEQELKLYQDLNQGD